MTKFYFVDFVFRENSVAYTVRINANVRLDDYYCLWAITQGTNSAEMTNLQIFVSDKLNRPTLISKEHSRETRQNTRLLVAAGSTVIDDDLDRGLSV